MNGSGLYISLSEAGKLSGYTAEYLRQLCVKGKLEGQKIGKSWVTTAAAVKKFKNAQQALPLTLGQITGTSVFSYSKLQKAIEATVAVVVFLPVAGNLVRLTDKLAYLRDKTNQVTVSTQTLINRKVEDYLVRKLQELGIKNNELGEQGEVAGEKI